MTKILETRYYFRDIIVLHIIFSLLFCKLSVNLWTLCFVLQRVPQAFKQIRPWFVLSSLSDSEYYRNYNCLWIIVLRKWYKRRPSSESHGMEKPLSVIKMLHSSNTSTSQGYSPLKAHSVSHTSISSRWTGTHRSLAPNSWGKEYMTAGRPNGPSWFREERMRWAFHSRTTMSSSSYTKENANDFQVRGSGTMTMTVIAKYLPKPNDLSGPLWLMLILLI